MITKAIIKAIKKYERIIILRHILPDGDAYGSQLGLKYLITANFKNKIVKVGGQDSEYLNFIGIMDNINDDDYENSLVIVTDCANKERIDDQRFKNAKMVIKIDHHLNGNNYSSLSWVDSSYVAASEMIVYLAIKNKWKISAEAARVLYHGIVTDSGRFLYSKRPVRTLKLAAYLLTTNFDVQLLYNQMYMKKIEELDFISYVYQNYQKYHQVIVLKLSMAMIFKHQWKFESVSSQVNLLANIENYPIWAFFVENEDNSIRVELRSNRYQVNEIASKYGGGGHKFAAGIKLNDTKIDDDIIERIIKDLENLI